MTGTSSSWGRAALHRRRRDRHHPPATGLLAVHLEKTLDLLRLRESRSRRSWTPWHANFRQTDYEIRPLMSAIFRSAEFYSPEAVRTQIKSPVQWVVQTGKVLETGMARPQITINALRQLGQIPFAPPNVKGWDGGRAGSPLPPCSTGTTWPTSPSATAPCASNRCAAWPIANNPNNPAAPMPSTPIITRGRTLAKSSRPRCGAIRSG